MSAKSVVLAAAMAVGLAGAGSDSQGTSQQRGKTPAPVPGWLSDVPSGFATARKTGRPMMVVFR